MCIYYGFFTHDKAVLEEVSWHTAQKAMLLVAENSSMKDGAFSWVRTSGKRAFMADLAEYGKQGYIS